uniref:Dual-action ribosomal maturation protein DarP n=1 Tax=uncultured Thiotrichaceae bacterium TaxID=298394 RepID=A0A6S6UK67_9GAMM|nr:MAG: FIG138315: Putative alpha helix protein [uncultured Thiotrichaceae bacterium]
MHDDEDEKIYAERPDRAALKLEVQANKELVLHLMNMSESLFKKMDIPERLRDAIVDARRFKGGARKRQLLYTTGLIRHEDPEALKLQIENLERPIQRKVEEFHEVEQWRDQLLVGDASVLDQLLAQFQGVDIQYLRQLVRNAAKEKKQNKPPKSARLLFQYLKELQDA